MKLISKTFGFQIFDWRHLESRIQVTYAYIYIIYTIILYTIFLIVIYYNNVSKTRASSINHFILLKILYDNFFF